MRKSCLTMLLAMTVAAPAAASEQTDVIQRVQQFVDRFNKGDADNAVKACAAQTTIIDEFPPMEWRGSGACVSWANDYVANATKEGISDGVVTLGEPRNVGLSGDHAYVVFPAD